MPRIPPFGARYGNLQSQQSAGRRRVRIQSGGQGSKARLTAARRRAAASLYALFVGAPLFCCGVENRLLELVELLDLLGREHAVEDRHLVD